MLKFSVILIELKLKIKMKSPNTLIFLALINTTACIKREPLLSYGEVFTAAKRKGINHPINYSVPNFGVD